MNCVASFVVGEEFEKLAQLTHPLMRAYAQRIGAAFEVVGTPRVFTGAPVMYEKLQIGKLLDRYERVIYLDTDAVVRPGCPDLLQVVPEGSFGAFLEGRVLDNGARALRQAKVQWGIDLTHRVRDFFNAGVMVFDRSHRRVFDPPAVFHDNFGDNTWTCMQVMTHVPEEKVFDIGHRFNHMCSVHWAERFTSHIVHYASNVKNQLPADLPKLFTP